MKNPQRVLVTGGSGFIGTHLCRALAASGHAITSLDLDARRVPLPGVRDLRGDVRDPKALQPLVEEADVVCHLAATVSVPLCQRDPQESYSNNLAATLQVLEAIREKQSRGGRPTRLLFASTAAVYGSLGDGGQALGEEAVAESFGSYYAAQKHAAEQAIRLYCKFHGVASMIFRFFNVYGEGQDPSSPYSGVITVFSDRASRGEALKLQGGGAQTRDFIAVADAVSACVKAIDVPASRWTAEPVNLGTQASCTIRELAEMIRSIARSSSKIELEPRREGDVQHSKADITRALARIPGWKPRQTLAAGLEQLLSSRGGRPPVAP